ncbi:MAG: NADP-dependent phosphogluconate dehydrogenase [Polyangiaceae bacterium]|nr:NADP-dependent phosphogluconate dehydrogenase [Polyangiaceae bacterium]
MNGKAMGMVGLGVMGRNLALNMEEKGFSIAAYDAWPDPVDRFVREAEGKNVAGFKDAASFVAALERPRRIVMLVKAGDVVDKTIAALRPHLEAGDVLVDAGNEHFSNTERRAKELSATGIVYFGMGVSGGEEGARHGPSMMPGGAPEGYARLKDVLEAVAAKDPDGGACVTHCGPGGAGHYVKMVHNGIEYGDMQLIAEAYDVLRTLGGLSNAELADVFSEWNAGELESFLIQITSEIFRKKDPDGKGDLLDQILDATAMKGTGKWTVQDAADVGAPIPTIATSVDARMISFAKSARVQLSKLLPGPTPSVNAVDKRQLIADVRAALYSAKTCSYAQGLHLLRLAGEARSWGFDLGELARIWQAGCIIRARFLRRIKAAYTTDPKLVHLLADASFREELASRQEGWRKVVAMCAERGLPLLTMSASLGYYDMVRRERLPANLTQAQRDFFGAHTYKRIDREGDFHTDWSA